jgi:hypothetical protein
MGTAGKAEALNLARQGRIMWKTISAIAAAALIAGAITLLQGSDVSASAPVAAAKSDRADLQPNCEQQGWPHYQVTCLRDDSRNAGRVLPMRVISTDRIAQANPNTKPDLAPHWPVTLTELQIAAPAWAK